MEALIRKVYEAEMHRNFYQGREIQTQAVLPKNSLMEASS